jgi:hypothetical protein
VQGDGKLNAACIDGERLAAWADGGLRPAEAATVEQHLSECARCQALLAVFVRTTPEAPVTESLWHRWRLAWLVPVATAATAVALWVSIPRNQTAPTLPTAQTVARENAAPAQETPAAAADAMKEAAAPAAPTAPLARRDAAKLESRAAEAEESQQARARQAAEPTVALEAPARLPEADQADQRTADTQATGRLVAPAPPAAAAGAPAAPSERSERAFAAREIVAQFQVISPDPATRWRVIGGQVERSTTGGTRWEPTIFPEATTLTAGASPAPSICWFVGRTGAVYVTTDGLRFTRVPFPERTDFVSIRPTDGRRATVITIDGRTFSTEDQGTTWTRVTP